MIVRAIWALIFYNKEVAMLLFDKNKRLKIYKLAISNMPGMPKLGFSDPAQTIDFRLRYQIMKNLIFEQPSTHPQLPANQPLAQNRG